MDNGQRHAFFPGTFDPPTLGHVDLVRRSHALFARVTVGIAVHPDKRHLFDVDERVALFADAVQDLDGVQVVRVSGLVVHACKDLGCNVIVRGVRSGTDFDYEVQMARTNRQMEAIDTILLAPSPELAHVSSTLVRQIASMRGDVSPFVSPRVLEALEERFRG